MTAPHPTDPPAREERNSGPELLIDFTIWGGALLFVTSLLYYLYAYLVRFGRPAGHGSVAVSAAADLLLFSAFAFHHSVFARTGLKAWVARVASPVMERSIYTWISAALFLLVCRVWQPVPGVLYRFDGWAAWPGYVLQAAGIALTLRGAAAVDVLDLAGVRRVLDARRGLLRAHVPLETAGVYSIVRHPLYLGWAIFVFTAPHMTATRFVFALISTGYLALAIPWEERGLIAVFGDEYRSYQTRVRWRMLPGIY